MHPWQTRLARQLEDLHLLRCSLLPDERFTFVLHTEGLATWTSLLDAFADTAGLDVGDHDGLVGSLVDPPCQARFEVRASGVRTWFEVVLPPCMSPDANGPSSLAISVKGDHSRDAHERWTAEIGQRLAEMDPGCAFPAYELLTQLTAALHQPHDCPSPPPLSTVTVALMAPDPPYHALLTSHHLISPTKRRTMHNLASRLGLAGFAKVGYPGIMYAEGPRESVEAFVKEIKAMQWLALRVRFAEPVPRSDLEPSPLEEDPAARSQAARWVELSKVGEVLGWMRNRGREELVTNLGIGASKEPRC